MLRNAALQDLAADQATSVDHDDVSKHEPSVKYSRSSQVCVRPLNGKKGHSVYVVNDDDALGSGIARHHEKYLNGWRIS